VVTVTGRNAIWTALAVVASLGVSATAGSTHYRDVRADYATAGGVADVISGETSLNGAQYGAVTIPTRRGEYGITVSLHDTTGTPVAADVAQDADGDGEVETVIGSLCGRTSVPLRLARSGAPVIVYVLAGSCGSGVSTPTTGTVSARLFSRTR
jgi:hypothetical protein